MSRFSSRRVEIESRIERQVEVESAKLSARSRSSVAIGATSRGGVCSKFGLAAAEGIDPAHFRHQADDVAHRHGDADDEHADDQPVQAGIGHEGVRHLAVEDERHKRRDDQEDDHPDQEDPRTRKHIGVEVAGHRSSSTKRAMSRFVARFGRQMKAKGASAFQKREKLAVYRLVSGHDIAAFEHRVAAVEIGHIAARLADRAGCRPPCPRATDRAPRSRRSGRPRPRRDRAPRRRSA